MALATKFPQGAELSIDLTKSGVDYDPWDHDETRPKKYPPNSTVEWSPETLTQARDELFEKGSEFRPTRRHEIVGVDNVLVEIDEIIHWLAHAKQYQRHDARLEPGVIFEGDPGTGKTLVSRYIATESNAFFLNVRDFPHLGSLFKDADIRDLFARARAKYAATGHPVILFWDEFENGACERANASPEQTATVSQLTAELDGVNGKNEGILLVGCTNYIYGIDQALKRSGRMGLQIEFHAPDRSGKKLLLGHYLGKYNIKGDIDVDTLSYFFDSTATAADIEEACMEAWRYAVRRTLVENGDKGRRKPVLAQEDLIGVFIKRLVGPPTAFINLPLEDRAHIAVHECGHAIAALVYEIPLRLITVQPGKKSLGRVITAEVNEYIGTMEEMENDMRVAVGSIAAEQVAGLPAALGSVGDVEAVNKIAAKLVDNLYQGRRTSLFNPRAVGGVRSERMGTSANPNVSADFIKDSDLDVRGLLDTTYTDVRKTMNTIGKEYIWAIANEVNERVTLTGAEFYDLFVSVTGREPGEFR